MFIELHRAFHRLQERSESEDYSLFATGQSLNWADLNELYRVVILSEAGSGKTEEISNATQQLRAKGKPAFFIRLEHVAAYFECAFEEGSFAEFQAWQATDAEGWLFLDSVDESRLKNPNDFDLAIRRLGVQLGTAKQRLHIVITSRTSAWRSATDLNLCSKHLAVNPKQGKFEIVTLGELTAKQVEIFITAKGVKNTQLFLNAIERTDAWSFTTRPQDLAELTEFWNIHDRIGNRLELMKNSVERRLKERDQTRAVAKPLSYIRALSGAKMISAASTLAHEPTIGVPDGAENSQGLAIKAILTDWDDRDCTTLLSRPIFDQAIYDAVRFHHRSVREYLTAEWISDLLKRQTSRQRIEGLFFRQQYGLEVIVPAMRSVLPWLAIADEKIRDRLRRVAPEVLLEGGDPTQFPLITRQEILSQVCEQLNAGNIRRHSMDLNAVQRFASTDLVPDIRVHIQRYMTDDDLLSFLLRMVWRGQLVDLLPEAKMVALSASAGNYPRNVAFKIISELGSNKDKSELRQSFLSEAEVLDRNLLAELLKVNKPSTDVVDWLFECLKKIEKKKAYSVDMLSASLIEFIALANIDIVKVIVDKASVLIESHPVIERRHCEISTSYAWLLGPTALAVERLVKSRTDGAINPAVLSILHKMPILKNYASSEVRESKTELAALVPYWAELHLALFWHHVEHVRESLTKNNGGKLTDWWQAGTWDSYIRFGAADFDLIACEIANRALTDDKLVALSLAFNLYRNHGRNPLQLAQLKKAVRSDSALSASLKTLLHPPKLTAEQKKHSRMNAQWQRRSRQRQQVENKNQEAWRTHVISNVAALRNPGFKEPDAISSAQQYLHESMRKTKQDSSRWSDGNWLSLTEEFGEEVACAFRDGAVAYWRRHRPKLISEGAEGNVTAFATIFGLTGLAIEAHETENWPETLDVEEVELAFRYAMRELNGFPPWFNTLLPKFTDEVRRLSLTEIDYELSNGDGEKASSYLLYDVSWSGDWLWHTVSPSLYQTLSTKEPGNLQNLGYALKIIQGSQVSDDQISQLAKLKIQTLTDIDHLAYWFAVWTGVNPEQAIQAFEDYLSALTVHEIRTHATMLFITQIVGGRQSGGSSVRERYRTPTCLKSLYILANRHVRQSEDIERAGKGVYSPELRDDAQDARNRLFALLKDIPGKEAFLAMEEISKTHPDELSRPWFALEAKTKAEADADSSPWSVAQVCDFYQVLERTPSTHRDLFDLAILRLIDLKSDIEDGDSSVASILMTATNERDIAKYIGNSCRTSSNGRYSIPQEEELADAKRPDFRLHGVGFDAPVPVELKLADNWTGPQLFERLEVQLCGDYLRDARSNRGIFLLCYRGKDRQHWQPPSGVGSVDFDGLIMALQNYWLQISGRFPGIDEIRVIGIDLTKRSKPSLTSSNTSH